MLTERKHNPAECPVLVADDEAPIREFVSRALASQGYPVTVVEDGQAALEMLAERPFRLLISDIVMPNLDGIALALKVARDYPNTKIMLISGYAAERQRAHNLEVLIHRIVPKPFSLIELLQMTNDVLDK